MQKKLISRISIMATPVMIVCGLLASGTSARAESGDAPCSNRTLQGRYGFAVEGIVLAIPAVPLPPGATLPVRGCSPDSF